MRFIIFSIFFLSCLATISDVTVLSQSKFEAIDYDSTRGQFVVGRQNGVSVVGSDGSLTTLVNSPHASKVSDLQISGSDLFIATQKGYVRANLATGVLSDVVAAGGKISGIAAVNSNKVYLADVFGAGILKVENGVSEELVSGIGAAGSGPTGIVYNSASDSLIVLVANADQSALYVIDCVTKAVSQVAVDIPVSETAAQVRFTASGNLLVVSATYLFEYATTDAWVSAKLKNAARLATFNGVDVAIAGSETYVLNQQPATVSKVVLHPYLIEMVFANLFPEGIEYDADRDQFVIGSFGGFFPFANPQGVNLVDDAGTVTSLTAQTSDLGSTIGVHIKDGKLHVARNDMTEVFLFTGVDTGKFMSGYARIDLATGVIEQMVDITRMGGIYTFRLANDLVVTDDGTVYMSDYFGSEIVKITPDGVATSFISSPEWIPQAGDVGHRRGPNGIEWSSATNTLIVGTPVGVPLWTVDLDAATPSAVPVGFPTGGSMSGPDGIFLTSRGTLVCVEADTMKVQELETKNNWINAAIISTGRVPYPFMTTVVPRGDSIYVVNSNYIMGPGHSSFEIAQVIMGQPQPAEQFF